MIYPLRICIYSQAILLLLSSCNGNPISTFNDPPITSTLTERAVSGGVMLRIMPLGASIVHGSGSTDNNGFRLGLKDRLIAAGNPVHYVGTQYSGLMANNQHEGYPGLKIAQVRGNMYGGLAYYPNVVVIHLGTNDCLGHDDTGNMHIRMAALIDSLFATVPGVTIFLGKLIPIRAADQVDCINTFNKNLDGVLAARSNQKLRLVDLNTNMLSLVSGDNIHPGDAGYIEMGKRFAEAIRDSGSLITTPKSTAYPDTDDGNGGNNRCEKRPGIGPFQIQQGSGTNDGSYRHGALAKGEITNGFGKNHTEGVVYADISGNGSDDYVWVSPQGRLGVALRYPNYFGGLLEYDISHYCLRRGVRFADINGDGRDDFLCISPNGDVLAWLNRPGADPRQPIWEELGLIKGNEGQPQENVRFGDIDGDGRADYMIIVDGTIRGWRNGGTEDKPAFWQDMGVVIGGVTKVDTQGISFFDINGDGRDDYCYMNPSGKTQMKINQRGSGLGLAPQWIDVGVVHHGVGAIRANIAFGKLSNTPRKDYAVVGKNGAINLWQNMGAGGTRLKGDGTRYCDMNGDGRDDYIWMDKDGIISFYRNTNNPPFWGPNGVIYNGVGAPRKHIHLADLDNDRRCDYLVVDPAVNSVRMIKNNGQTDGKFTWTDKGTVFNAGACAPGNKIIFADLDGDGKDDIACVGKNGDTTAWLNTGPVAGKWNFVGLIKASVGADQANVRFADINGDGKADYLWLEKYDGKVTAWTNNGRIDGAWSWTSRGVVATGIGHRGETINFANMGGLGRADYIYVEPATNKAWVWWNRCPGAAPPAPLPPVEHPPSPDPAPTPAPPAIPVVTKPETDPWQMVNCENAAVTETSTDPTERWDALDTEGAWNAAITYWKSNKNSGTFMHVLTDFLDYNTEMDCGTMALKNSCNGGVTCNQVKHPAAAFILNSVATVSMLNYNFYFTLLKSQVDFISTISKFSKEFAPAGSGLDNFKLIMDIVGLGFAVALAPLWNVAYKTAPFWKNAQNELGTMKDTVNPSISNGITIAKDTKKGATQIDNTQTLTVMMAGVINSWEKTLDLHNIDLFDGSDRGIDMLWNIIKDGKLLGGDNTVSDAVAQRAVDRALYAYMIPYAWTIQQVDMYPFISMNEELGPECDRNEGTVNSGCTEDGFRFDLLAVSGIETFCTPNFPSTCEQTQFIGLPGMASLDNVKWGGLNQDDFVIGAIETYNANGFKNGATFMDPTAVDDQTELLNGNGVRMPGVVIIPVCSKEEARRNWKNGGKDNSNYPCDR